MVIADDHSIVRRGLKTILSLSEEFIVVGKQLLLGIEKCLKGAAS